MKTLLLILFVISSMQVLAVDDIIINSNADKALGSSVIDNVTVYMDDGIFIYNYFYNKFGKFSSILIKKKGANFTIPTTQINFTYNSKGFETIKLWQKYISGKWINTLMFKKTYDIYSNIVSETSYKWNNNKWEMIGKTNYVYDSNKQKKSATFYVYENNKMTESWKLLYKYDANGNNIETIKQVYTVNNYYDTEKNTWEYDNKNQMLSWTMQYRYLNQWINIKRTVYKYDSKGNNTSATKYKWVNNNWFGDTRSLYTFNIFNNLTEELNQELHTIKWENVSRTKYSYHLILKKNKLTNILEQKWVNNDWSNVSKYDYTYDKLGNQFTCIFSVWSLKLWVQSTKMTTKYNQDNLINYIHNEKWNGVKWIDDQVPMRFTDYKDRFFSFFAYLLLIHYQGETGVEDETGGKALKVYPNPASDYLIVNLENLRGKIIIYNLSGTVIEEYGNLKGINNYRIDVSNFSSGVYLLKYQIGSSIHITTFVVSK